MDIDGTKLIDLIVYPVRVLDDQNHIINVYHTFSLLKTCHSAKRQFP